MDTIYVSVEGIDVDEWRQTFEDELAQRLGPTKVSFFVPSVPGGAAAERGNRVGVCFKVSVNWAAVSVILQAVTLALSLIQPLPPTSPVPTVTCTIQGPNGSKTLEVRGGAVSEQAIDACLLDTGAAIDTQDANAATALHRATRTQCAAAVEYLLHVGSDPTTRNKTGATAFHLAVQHTGRGGTGTDEAKMAQQQIIAAFISSGANPALKDGKGLSVIDRAKSACIRELLSGDG